MHILEGGNEYHIYFLQFCLWNLLLYFIKMTIIDLKKLFETFGSSLVIFFFTIYHYTGDAHI